MSTRKIVDCHVHLGPPEKIEHLVELADAVDAAQMGIVCTTGTEGRNATPSALAAKAAHPDRFFAFAGLDHSAHHSGGKLAVPGLAEQVDRFIALGADGIKMLENKPTSRKQLDIPVDGEYFEEYFAKVEETGFPVLWHVADPEEFWDPATTPKWALERGWGYDKSHVAKETLYREVEHVLERHPKLNIMFAHFYFLSADLPRAAAFLDRFGSVKLDLAPGVEFLYNMSKDVDAARAFFEKYADRIVFGTDISSGNTVPEAKHRLGIVRRWLETSDEYRVTDDADFLLGPPEDGVMRGLSLSAAALDKICNGNYESVVGASPRPLVKKLAREECERIAAGLDHFAGGTAEDNPARRAAALL